jgi:hypothetical protein
MNRTKEKYDEVSSAIEKETKTWRSLSSLIEQICKDGWNPPYVSKVVHRMMYDGYLEATYADNLTYIKLRA